MSIGENVKDAAVNTQNLTDTVVDAVESKVAEVVDAVQSGVDTAADKVKETAGPKPEAP